MNLVENLEYNTEREHLIIPEYGRHFQKMVNFAISIEDREERNKIANAIVTALKGVSFDGATTLEIAGPDNVKLSAERLEAWLA